MKVLSKEVLIRLLETEFKDDENIWPDDFKYMFFKYGDEYYLESGEWVKTVENPEAKEILERRNREDDFKDLLLRYRDYMEKETSAAIEEILERRDDYVS